MVKNLWQYVKPFSSTGTSRTNRETDRRTDGQTDGQNCYINGLITMRCGARGWLKQKYAGLSRCLKRLTSMHAPQSWPKLSPQTALTLEAPSAATISWIAESTQPVIANPMNALIWNDKLTSTINTLHIAAFIIYSRGGSMYREYRDTPISILSVSYRRFRYRFYRATRTNSAVYAVTRCLSVCTSVPLSHAGIQSKRLHVSQSFFSVR